MSEQENVRIAHTLFDNFNAREQDRSDPLYADDFVGYGTGRPPGGVTWAQVKAVNEGFLTAFPDLHFDITLTIAQGDYVVAHWTSTGTHTGPLTTPSGNTIPPTGKSATLMGSGTLEIKNGKATRGWVYWDMASLLGQLGLMPPM